MPKYTFGQKETAEYLSKRPRKSLAVKIVFKSDTGTILLVKPNYKNGWQFPGGGVETLEDPKDAAIREIAEEIGLVIDSRDLNLLDTVFREEQDDLIIMYEYLRPISSTQKLKIQEEELEDYSFEEIEAVPSKIGTYYKDFWHKYVSKTAYQ